jgi:hypothetical protein
VRTEPQPRVASQARQPRAESQNPVGIRWTRLTTRRWLRLPHASVSGSVSGSESKKKWSLRFDPELELELELELDPDPDPDADADPDPDADAELANLNSIPNGNRFGAAMS